VKELAVTSLTMRFRLLVLVLLPAAGVAATAQYTIALHNRTAEVRARFPKATEDAVTFKLQSWAGTDFYRDIEGVAASDFRGNPLPVESKAEGEWVVQNHRRPFELTWRVKATKDSILSGFPGSQFHATLLKDWVLMWGHAFVLNPVHSSLSAIQVKVRMQTNEYGHWDSTLHSGGALPHLEDLSDQLFIAGAFRSYRQPGGQYYFATTQAKVPDRELMDAVDKILVAQTHYMGTKPSRFPMFVFTDGGPGSSGGTVVRNSAVFYPDLSQDLTSNNRGALRLIGHEIFHLWNGTEMKHKDDAEWSDGKYGWFTEGFTDYYSGATLYRAGIFDGTGFAAFLNRVIMDYTQNAESLRATMEDLGSQHWRDRDHQRLPYTKGALLGLLMDLQLRAKGRSLDDYMRAILRKREYGLADLRSAWIALAGESGAEFWDRYIPTAAPLPFAEVFRSVGVRFQERDTPVFDLGFTFDRANMEKDAKVLEVKVGSNAERAGIRSGDSLQGISVYFGDTSKEAKFGLLRGSERVRVAYAPVRMQKVVQIDESLEVLR
jgi:predicted metalloprotease with PDZ domain